jgi:putative membrane protein
LTNLLEASMRFIPLVAVLTTFAAVPTSAQFGNPGGLDPGTRESAPGRPIPGQTNVPDRLFTMLAAQGGMAEVDLGKLAQQRSRNDAVLAFAKRMIDEHGKSNAQLAQIAQQSGLAFPTEPASDQLETKQKLSALNPADFDVEYMRAQVTDHQKTVQLLLWVIASGESADLQSFAKDTLPDVLHHLQLAQTLVSQLTGAAPPPTD